MILPTKPILRDYKQTKDHIDDTITAAGQMLPRIFSPARRYTGTDHFSIPGFIYRNTTLARLSVFSVDYVSELMC